ncbi:MAG: NAD-dependent epimerase/dehydratase family protein [Bacteroidota bacterium]
MVLITGGTGFLGKYLVEACLEAGLEVRLLVRGAKERKLPYGSLVEVVDGDILDVVSLEKAVEGVDFVIHAAAMVSFWGKDRERLREVNVDGTANVVNACLDANIRRLVHVSSIAAIGRSGGSQLNDEESPVLLSQANSGYARSKILAERQIYRGIAEGLEAVIVNPGLILGPGEWTSGTPKLFATIAEGMRFYPAGMVGVVSAKDVAKACLQVMEGEVAEGERFVLVAENMPYQRLFGKIAQALQVTPPSKGLAPWLARLAGTLAEQWANLWGKQPLITRASMRSATQPDQYDGSKIERMEVDYQDTEQLIEETAAAFLSR